MGGKVSTFVISRTLFGEVICARVILFRNPVLPVKEDGHEGAAGRPAPEKIPYAGKRCSCAGQIHVSVYGGARPHIGAVSIRGFGPEETRDTEFSGHRDSVVSARWADALADAGFAPVVAEAGIHYDNLSKEGVRAVLGCTEEMLAELLFACRADESKV